jgi:hypothetical protein
VRLAAAASSYFGSVFAVGFILGIVRTIVLEPIVGALVSVIIEMPIILLASWFLANWVVQYFRIVSRRHALLVGLCAVFLLWLAELALALTMGATFDEWAHGLMIPPGLLGVAGQVVFAMLPVLVVTRRMLADEGSTRET